MSSQPTKERKWPKMSDAKEWSMFNEDLDRMLEVVQAGSAERKVDSLTAITYNMAKERFGRGERTKSDLKSRTTEEKERSNNLGRRSKP